MARENIKLELWDHDPNTLIGALKDYRMTKSCRGCCKSTKDFFEVLFSSLLPCIQIDDRVGFCLINLDDVPATGVKLTKSILDKNTLAELGTIRMHLDWGFLKISCKKDKLISILMHMKLYAFCLNLHLEQGRKDTIKELKIEKINYMLLFYKTELTLINQNRVRGCLTDYEDGIIRRAIIMKTILKLSVEDRSSRLLLNSMLVNEDLSTPESLIWIHSDYLKELREFEKSNLMNLVQFYTNRFDAFKVLTFNKELDCDTLDVLQFLRIMVKYEQCYADAKFDVKINSELRNYIVNNLINEMLSDPEYWTQLANKLDFLDENLEKYWQQNIRTILNQKGVDTIRKDYEKNVYNLVREKIDEWSMCRDTDDKAKFRKIDNQLITWYFFCKKFEFIVLDDNRLIKRREAGIQQDKRETENQLESQPAIQQQDSRLPFGAFQAPERPTGKVGTKGKSNSKSPPKTELSLASIQREQGDEKNELDINNLTFCYLVNNRSISESLKRVFPKHLLSSWMADRVSYCMALAIVIADQEINRLIPIVNDLEPKEVKTSYSTVEKFFYETLTETLYFFNSLQYWDEYLFEQTIDRLCECLFTFAKTYKKLLTDKPKSMDPQKMVVLILIGINELFRLNDKLFNRILIQVITDLPADEVWKCIDKHSKLMKQKKEDKTKGDEQEKEEEPGNKPSEAELIKSLNSPTSKLVIKVCFRIRNTFNKIYELIKDLEQRLGKRTVKEFEKNLNAILNSKKHYLMLKVIEQLEKSLRNIFYYLTNQQTMVDVLIFIKHNLNLNLRIAFMQLIEQYVDEAENQNADCHLTKIKIIKLITISSKLKELFKQISDSLDGDTRKLTAPFLNTFFIDTKEFRNLSNKL